MLIDFVKTRERFPAWTRLEGVGEGGKLNWENLRGHFEPHFVPVLSMMRIL